MAGSIIEVVGIERWLLYADKLSCFSISVVDSWLWFCKVVAVGRYV